MADDDTHPLGIGDFTDPDAMTPEMVAKIAADLHAVRLDRAAAVRAEDQIHLHPWDHALVMTKIAMERGLAFQRWLCGECGAIQTMPYPNAVYEQGHCEECDSITDLRVSGFDVIALAAEDQADAPKAEAFLRQISAELASEEDAVKVRARGGTPRRKAHRPPCRNCGQPFHKGRCQKRRSDA